MQRTLAFVGSRNTSAPYLQAAFGVGIFVVESDTATVRLKLLSERGDTDNPGFLTIDPISEWTYAGDEAFGWNEGIVSVFSIGAQARAMHCIDKQPMLSSILTNCSLDRICFTSKPRRTATMINIDIAPTVSVSFTYPQDRPANRTVLPMWNAESWMYADWPSCRRFLSLRGMLAEGNARLSNVLVTDVRACARDGMFASSQGMFGRRLVAGAFVFAAKMGLVAINRRKAVSCGYDRLRFTKPVFIGDTIYAIRTNLEKRPRYFPTGLVRASYEVFKSKGRLVLYGDHPQAVKCRGAESVADQIEKP